MNASGTWCVNWIGKSCIGILECSTGVLRRQAAEHRGNSNVSIYNTTRYTYIISGPERWKLVSRLTTRDATICIQQSSETMSVSETRLTVEAIAAGTLKMTLMMAFKSSTIIVVAITLDPNLTHEMLCDE